MDAATAPIPILEARAMPLRRMLEGRNFDPKAAAILVEAFNEIIDELDLRTLAAREKAARIVIELAAGKAALDVARLRDETVRVMRMEVVGADDLNLNHRGGVQGDRAAGQGAAAAD
jgi:hypothetical protein